MVTPTVKTISRERKLLEDDYSGYHEGDKDPATGKTIFKVIMNNPNFIVYLTPELGLEWSVTEDYEEQMGKYSPLYGIVISKATQLENMAETSVMPEKQKKEYRVLLGNAIAHMLDKLPRPVIRGALRNAEAYLKDRLKEKARVWYLTASLITTVVALLISSVFWILRDQINLLAGREAADVILSTGFGALGAMISILSRSSRLDANVAAGRRIHSMEGVIRILVGICGAMFLAIAVKANLVLGAINGLANPFAVMLTMCIGAGASERIVPSLIRQVEGLVNPEGEKDVELTKPVSRKKKPKRK